MLELNSEITNISRLGAATAKIMKNIGIKTVRDLLFYFPFRYDDFSRLTLIKDLRPGLSANVVGQIEIIHNKRSPRRRLYITEALVRDETDGVRVVWFNQPFIAKILKAGDLVSLAGRAEEDYGGVFLSAPAYEKVSGRRAVHTQGFVPIYHSSGNLTQKQLRFFIKQIISLAGRVADWLPENIRKRHKLLPLPKALEKIHFPKNAGEAEAAKKRLAFNELFLVQLEAQMIKKEISAARAEKINFYEKETKEFVAGLPFKLTAGQRRSAWEILADMGREQPMARLLSGDVGSGKTVVAAIAALNTCLSGRQAVLMAPTEILASQHYVTFCRFFENFNIKIGLVTSGQLQITNDKLQIKNKKENIREEQEGGDKINNKNKINKMDEKELHDSLFIIHNSDIIIGTHALIQEKIKFNNLALAIIDEQHRFGVRQRKALVEKSSSLVPHLLSLTATPIPRSLSLVLFGDLDVSFLKEMPAGRLKTITRVVSESERSRAYEFVRQEIKKGRQAFVICPLIDPLDRAGAKSVEEEKKKLDRLFSSDFKIGELHGRMKSGEKEKIMREFLNNKINILVATSVVEVGIDIPNAAIMIVEGAEKFGLAQLHQLRGRVGRSDQRSYCLLFSESTSPDTLKRLSAMVDYHDGFSLAKIDLKFRGPGEVYGTLQKGFPELKIASLFDYELMKLAKEEAEKIMREDSDLENHQSLKEKIKEMETSVHLE